MIPRKEEILDCIIIGAGQAGLVCSRIAKEQGINALILEQGSAAGEAWRQRPPKLELFTPRHFSALQGLELTGKSSGYADCTEMAQYFDNYQKHFELPCHFNSQVTDIKLLENGLYQVICSNKHIYQTRSIVLANGSNQDPTIPQKLAANLGSHIYQTNARDYWKNIPKAHDTILVVGDGASGRQIALDFAQAGYKKVVLATTNRNLVKGKIFNKSIFYWLDHLGLLRANHKTLAAKILRKRNPIPKRETLNNQVLSNNGVTLYPKLTHTTADTCFFGDKQSLKPTYIIWSIGYQENLSILQNLAPITEQDISANYGKLPIDGVFVAGRKWLHSRASELIIGIEHDAKVTMQFVMEYLASLPVKNQR